MTSDPYDFRLTISSTPARSKVSFSDVAGINFFFQNLEDKHTVQLREVKINGKAIKCSKQ